MDVQWKNPLLHFVMELFFKVLPSKLASFTMNYS